ncbi:hypothetical protein Raf01_19170 [Rugosimonospora africana]|uniref:Catalytic LigB subunit of aromatic ring-opening dioxygenase n=2 Tax=Rugosimonospora africana TaxID=556532 RepID=A0A8J3QQA7_9ACTN|nr:hypothetical protein Raf01_19170 [Rugosimonospora africana]
MLLPELAGGAAAELDDLRAVCDRAVGRLLAADPDGILIVGTGPETAWRRPDEYGTLAPWGVPLEVVPGRRGRPALPLSLTVGAWLLSRSVDLVPVPAGATEPAGQPGLPADPSAVMEPAATAAAVAGGDPVPVGLASLATGEPPDGCAAFGRHRCAPWRSRVALLVMGDGSAYRENPATRYGDPRAEKFDATAAGALAGADLDGLMRLDPSLAADLGVAGRAVWQALAGAASGADWRAELLYDAAPYGVGYLVAAWEPAGGRTAGGSGTMG